jgi:hypothetical protein
MELKERVSREGLSEVNAWLARPPKSESERMLQDAARDYVRVASVSLFVRVVYTAPSPNELGRFKARPPPGVNSCMMRGLGRFVRGSLARDVYHDVDMANCQPSLLLQMATRRGLSHMTKGLASYVADRDAWLTLVQDGCGVSRCVAKTLLLRLTFLGCCQAWARDFDIDVNTIPSRVRALERELRSLAVALVAAHESGHLAVAQQLRLKPDTHNGIGTRLAYLVQDVERRCLEALKSAVEATGYEVGALIHDGLMVARKDEAIGKKEGLPDWLLTTWETVIKARTGFAVSLVEKPFETLADRQANDDQGEADDAVDDAPVADLADASAASADSLSPDLLDAQSAMLQPLVAHVSALLASLDDGASSYRLVRYSVSDDSSALNMTFGDANDEGGAARDVTLRLDSFAVEVDGEPAGYLHGSPERALPVSDIDLSVVNRALDSRMAWRVHRQSATRSSFCTDGPPHRAEIALLNQDVPNACSAKVSMPDKQTSNVSSKRNVGILQGAYSSCMVRAMHDLGIASLINNGSIVINNNNGAVGGGGGGGDDSGRRVRPDYDFLEPFAACGFFEDVVAVSEQVFYMFDALTGLWRACTSGDITGCMHQRVAYGVVPGLEPAEVDHLKSSVGASRVLRSFYLKLRQPDFLARLDSDPPSGSVPFANGMYDVLGDRLRTFTRDDMLTAEGTLGYAYGPMDDVKDVSVVKLFYERVLPDAGEREYVQRILAEAMFGRGRRKYFLVLSDARDGSNAKTTLMVAVRQLFGTRAAAAEDSFLCKSTSVNANGAAANLLAYRGKWLSYWDEPKDGELDIAKLKNLTSGASQQAGRALHSGVMQVFEWTPLIVLTVNEARFPKFDAGDAPFLKRMRALRMRSLFVPPERLPEYEGDENVYALDPGMVDVLREARLAHLGVLADAYRRSLRDVAVGLPLLGAEPSVIDGIVADIMEASDPRLEVCTKWVADRVDFAPPRPEAMKNKTYYAWVPHKALTKAFWDDRESLRLPKGSIRADYGCLLRRAMELAGLRCREFYPTCADGKQVQVSGYDKVALRAYEWACSSTDVD